MKRTPSSDALDRALTSLYQADVPEGYQASWRDAVKREEPSPMKSTPRLAWLRRAALPIAAAVVLVIGTAVTGIIAPKTPAPEPAQSRDYDLQAATASNATGAMEKYGDSLTYEASFDRPASALASTASSPRSYPEAEEGGADNSADETAMPDSRKIIRSASLSISSAVFDQDYAAILSLTEGMGGYASSVSMVSEQTDKRYASFALKIPSENLDGFLTGLSGVGRITDRYESATDQTTQYTDTALRLQTQLDKMDRLQELMLQAETVEDLLYIESEIADTQYRIDSLQTSLNAIDRQVDYSSVAVYLREQTPADTAGAEDISIGERLVNGLKASVAWIGGFFENMLVFLAAAAPVLVPLVIAYIVYRVVRKHRKAGKSS